jgi:hypothetical protein
MLAPEFDSVLLRLDHSVIAYCEFGSLGVNLMPAL